MKFETLLEKRTFKIDDQSSDEWYWIKADEGAWGSETHGPIGDWLSSHKDKFYKYVKSFDVVITAGANCGMYTRFHGARFNTVYAFEPDYLNFYCMVLNNPEEHIIKFNCALGLKPGPCQITRLRDDNVGMHTVSSGSGAIPMLAIDSLKLPSVDLIQLDVEGHEFDVLQGAFATITNGFPVIILENGQRAEIKRFLGQLGYGVADQSAADTIYVHGV